VPGNIPIETACVLPAGVEHLAEIAGLAAEIWHLHYPGIISEAQIDYMLKKMYDPERMRQDLAEGIAYDRLLLGNALAGFASYGASGQAATFKLHKIYVHPRFHKHGLGRLLISAAQSAVRSKGGKRLVLSVNKSNRLAIAAYLRWGFKIEEAVRVDIGGGFVMDDYVMSKEIGSCAG
jgi:diamine N-acetyltransferase